MLSLNILFPVLNEEKRLQPGIENTYKYMKENMAVPFTLTIADNGSADRTEEISRELCGKYPEVQYIKTEEKGVGIAFMTGVRQNTADIVGYMDVDLSTDIRHLSEMYEIMRNNPDVQIVNASRWNRASNTTGRKWYRNLTSHGLIWLVHLLFHIKSTDVICGFKFFRKESLKQLVQETEPDNGWFYIIELLIRAYRDGVNVYELPVRWQDDYNTTVNVKKTTLYYLKKLFSLKRKIG